MTSTEFTVGLGESARVSSKVLKPPGGGSSDIFGLGNQCAAGKASNDKQSKFEDSSTHSRVFGGPVRNDVLQNVQSPMRNGVQSKIVENGNAVPVKQTKKSFIRRNPITGEEIEISVENENEDKSNDKKEDKDEESPNTPAKPVQTSIRIRNPPGGKSSGIF